MNPPRAVLKERLSPHGAWLGAGLALVGLMVALAWGAGQSGGKPQVFFTVEQSTNHLGGGAALSPDGSTLVYVGEDDGLHALNLGTGQKQLLLRQTRPGLDVFGAPAFSPDGTRIIFVASGGTLYYPADIYSVHLDGSGLRQLTHAIQPIPEEKATKESDVWYQQFVSPQFSPDGTKILLGLFDPSRPNEEVALISADGSGLKLLGQGEPLFWAADSESVYYYPAARPGKIEKLDLASGTSEAIQGLPQGLVDPEGVIPNILGKLPDKDWFIVAAPDTQKVSLMSVQHGVATFQSSLHIPLSKATPKGPVSLVSIQWTPSGRVLLVYRGNEHGWMISEPTVNLERFEVAQASY